MDSTVITKNALDFLNKIAKNNTREWFAEHKVEYKKHEANVKAFYGSLMDRLNAHDEIEKLKMFRIYRDVRFSKDKTPYNSHFSGSFSRSGVRLRGGYFLKIKNNESFIATGFWEPNKEDLFRIRKEFELDSTDIRKIINDKAFKSIWGDIVGNEVKFAPKGFDKEDPNIDLIKRKQFIFVKNFTNEEVLSQNFIDVVDSSFKAVRPYFNLMSDILTTNLNGESLLD